MDATIAVRRILPTEGDIVKHSLPGVFDYKVKDHLLRRFLSSDHNVLVGAIKDDALIGFASGVIYVHPDKDPELWINEVGVASPYQRQGIATQILRVARRIAVHEGCRACWLLTEPDNTAANALYQSLEGWQGPEPTMMYSFDLKP